MGNSMKLNSYHMHGALHVKGSLTVNGVSFEQLNTIVQQQAALIQALSARVSDLEG